MPRIVYARQYNIGFYGLERLHPFDSRKYGRVWRVLRQKLGRQLGELHLCPDRPVTSHELQLVHSATYLEKLKEPQYLANALEVSVLRRLPAWAIDWHVLRPMRWATRGTILAAQAALREGWTVNLSGGYHHAKPEAGEGFSIYSDIGMAVAHLRQTGELSPTDRVVYVDCDAHQGNGVCHVFQYDSRVFLFDIFHLQIYPKWDQVARQRIDCPIGITQGCTDREYLAALKSQLPPFLDSITGSTVRLAIYNAGTDILKGDPLGQLRISGNTILERDRFVMQQLRDRDLPTVMVLSGGYTRDSFRWIADSLLSLLKDV